MPFVQPPVPVDGNPEPAHFPQGQVERSDGPGQYRGVGHLDRHALIGQQGSSCPGLLFPLL